MKEFIVCDIGKNVTHVYNPKTKKYSKIEHSDFIKLNIPELSEGVNLVIEDAHLRSQEDNSLAQAFTIDQLKQLKSNSVSKNNSILCFPQKVTPKARKIASLVDSDLLDKSDKNDVESIAYYLENFPNAFSALKEFNPVSLSEHEKKSSCVYSVRNLLTEDSNTARNENYGIKTSYSDSVTTWIKKYISILAFRLDDETRLFAGLELNGKGNALKPGLLNYTSDKIKFLYGVVNTILTPSGDIRVRLDNGLPPYWKYAKQVYFGITPYHMHAGVTASNYKYHKRKAGSPCKKSMSLESKNAITSLDDVLKIHQSRNDSDKKLRSLWKEVRKMIVEEGLR